MRRYIPATKNFWIFLIALLFSATLFGCTVVHHSGPYGVHYTGPPRIYFQGPPHLHHIPGSYVYVVADMDVGIFFYNGYWYRNHNNFWFRASYYNGSWLKVVIGSVPQRLHNLPGTYRRHIRRDSYRIPHRDLKQHYKRWEKDRYWDKGRGHENRKMEKQYKKKKQEYKKGQRRHGSELREYDRDERRGEMRPAKDRGKSEVRYKKRAAKKKVASKKKNRKKGKNQEDVEDEEHSTDRRQVRRRRGGDDE